MEEKVTFREALELYQWASMLREDLPDGMWHEIKEAVGDIVACYGRKVSEWPEQAKEEFTEAIAEIFRDWGFSVEAGLMS